MLLLLLLFLFYFFLFYFLFFFILFYFILFFFFALRGEVIHYTAQAKRKILARTPLSCMYLTIRIGSVLDKRKVRNPSSSPF